MGYLCTGVKAPHDNFSTVSMPCASPSNATSPLDSNCFFHFVDSYLAVITVSLKTGSTLLDSCSDGGNGTCVKVQRPNDQFKIYLAFPSGLCCVDSGVVSEDLGGVDAYKMPFILYTSSFVGSCSNVANLFVSTLAVGSSLLSVRLRTSTSLECA
ncbi:hypothetical protein P3342_001924 [Pyrenophora teres f. teres]|nr:hypothetical protein P3342_001924 [Pyrenophora teres f. teres]